MPSETQQAIDWALKQTISIPSDGIKYSVTKNTPNDLVNKVREYFNTNNISYTTFSYEDLVNGGFI